MCELDGEIFARYITMIRCHSSYDPLLFALFRLIRPRTRTDGSADFPVRCRKPGATGARQRTQKPAPEATNQQTHISAARLYSHTHQVIIHEDFREHSLPLLCSARPLASFASPRFHYFCHFIRYFVSLFIALFRILRCRRERGRRHSYAHLPIANAGCRLCYGTLCGLWPMPSCIFRHFRHRRPSLASVYHIRYIRTVRNDESFCLLSPNDDDYGNAVASNVSAAVAETRTIYLYRIIHAS